MYSTYFDEKEKLWHGSDIPPLYNPDISLAQALLNSMVAFAPKIAQVIIKPTNEQKSKFNIKPYCMSPDQ